MSYIIMSCVMVDTLKYTGEKALRQFEMAAVLLVVAIPQRLSNPCRARLSTLPSARGRGLWGRASTLRLLWGFPPIQLSFNAEPKIPSSSGTPLKVATVHLLAWFYWRVALCSAEQGLLHGPEACFREALITGDKMWCKCLCVHCKSALLCYPFFLFFTEAYHLAPDLSGIYEHDKKSSTAVIMGSTSAVVRSSILLQSSWGHFQFC